MASLSLDKNPKAPLLPVNGVGGRNGAGEGEL